MSVSRRGFVRTAGLGAAGLLSTSFVVGRGREAGASEAPGGRAAQDDGTIWIDTNENARGPGPAAVRAIREATNPTMGRGYPPYHVEELHGTIAEHVGVEESNVIVGAGSGDILVAATRAFCNAAAPLVTAAPSYGTPERTARDIGAGVRRVPVDASLRLDLDAMAEVARGAGMVFLCNPNNPTGTAHPLEAVEGFVRRVKGHSPGTAILIDEAYIDYAHDPAVKTAASLALELPGVFVTRSFSKAHGMAGLRIGYAVGREETVRAIHGAWNLGDVNTLAAAAATASLRDPAHIAEERRTNARIRDFVVRAFRDMGYEAHRTHTNFLFVNLGFPAKEFRDPCAEEGVRVGRDFPPMEKTHCRISLGTREEMEEAVRVFRKVLAA